jgi:hypothetical protein
MIIASLIVFALTIIVVSFYDALEKYEQITQMYIRDTE